MIPNDANNRKLCKQTEEANSSDDDSNDSTTNEITYGPGIVQKLCARFLQLFKEPNTVPPLRSPRFKRRKALAENNFAVISEIRRCNAQTFAPSKPTSEVLLNATKNDVNSYSEQKCELHFAPAEKMVDTVELNGTYLYRATVVPGDMKANRRAKKVELIREKFEKFSATSSTLPHKKLNKVRFRRGGYPFTVNTESTKRSESMRMHGEIRKAQHDESFEIERDKGNIQPSVLSDKVRVAMKLTPPDDNLTVTGLSAAPTVSSLSNIDHFEQEEMNNDQMKRIEKAVNDEMSIVGSFRLEPISSSTIVANTSVKMPDGKQSEQNGLQEVHRLLKKFNEIREERAKNCIHKDISAKTNNRCDTGDHDVLVQLQQYE
uniref:DUF4801 domain-containing protein n=1 Tax=Elaeophora elaphi TaxID=1147741 RepID=A0A0R3RTP6_9BILA